MKRIFISAMAFAMMAMLTSCTNVEGKADEFVKEEMEAASSLDFSQAKKIAKEADEYRESLSDDDKEKFDEAVLKATAKYEKEFAKKAEQMGKAMEGVFDGINEMNESLDDLDSDDESGDESKEDNSEDDSENN